MTDQPKPIVPERWQPIYDQIPPDAVAVEVFKELGCAEAALREIADQIGEDHPYMQWVADVAREALKLNGAL